MNKKTKMTGNELREFRKSLGMTQADLAEEWGIDRVTINSYERRGDRALPRAKMIGILCDWIRMNNSINEEAAASSKKCAGTVLLGVLAATNAQATTSDI